MKGKKEIFDFISEANNKELLLDNENILKGYIAEKSILPRLNNVPTNNNSGRKASFFRQDTVCAVNSLINSKKFMSEVKNLKSDFLKKKEVLGHGNFDLSMDAPAHGNKVKFSNQQSMW